MIGLFPETSVMLPRKFLLGCALAGLLPLAAVAAETRYVVIAVTGLVSDIKEGQTIDAGTSITLPPATSVHLLSATGQMVFLDGPFSGQVAAPSSAAPAGDGQVIARLAKFLSERRVATSALGATRSGVTAPQAREPADPWQIVVDESGGQCGRPSHVQLWRKNAAAEVKVRLSSTRADPVRAAWPRGQNALLLPAQFAVDQSTFQAGIGDRVTTIDLHLAPANLSNPAEIADWMVRVGCRRQALLFLETLR
jgi:hypothetical protein